MNAVKSRKRADLYNSRIERLVEKIETNREKRWIKSQIREQSRFGYYEYATKNTFLKFEKNINWLLFNGYKLVKNDEKGLKIEW